MTIYKISQNNVCQILKKKKYDSNSKKVVTNKTKHLFSVILLQNVQTISVGLDNFVIREKLFLLC